MVWGVIEGLLVSRDSDAEAVAVVEAVRVGLTVVVSVVVGVKGDIEERRRWG